VRRRTGASEREEHRKEEPNPSFAGKRDEAPEREREERGRKRAPVKVRRKIWV
jgi:hypothetical protein